MDESKTSKGQVLVVDDDPGIPMMLCQKLSCEGFDCESCSGGQEALALLRARSFDIVISDLQMPGMTGMELLDIVHKEFPRAAFLMVTGVDDVRVGIQAMKQGGADYVVKPLQLDALVASVQRALEKKRVDLEVENYRLNLEQLVEQRTKQLRAAMKRVENTYDETLQALGSALDLRDTETEGHSRRVSRYSVEMARAYGCSNDQLKQIPRGSYLHDIGKIGIPDAILLKPGKLTSEEREVMETHVQIGYDLVCRIAFLAGAAEIVLTHQEHYDGTGYPQGLVGDEIPIGARIFAVADTLDAMTSDRPYRRALPLSAARTEITSESDHQFDSKVVEVFLTIPEEDWENMRQEVAKGPNRFSGQKRASPKPSPRQPLPPKSA
jgi:response regulator RpfG family c-di-GMP phosphodiesterase